jgi:hypothetical protein
LTPIWIAIITSFPAFLATLVTAIVSIRNGFKADAIHILVDGNLTTVKKDLTEAKAEIAELNAFIKGQATGGK